MLISEGCDILPQRVKVYEALCALYGKRLTYIHVQKVARRAHVPVGTASRELAYLETMEIVKRKGSRGGWKPSFRHSLTYLCLLDVWRRERDYVRVRTLADMQGLSHWTIYKYVARLRDAGLLVMGTRGWKPKRHDDVVSAAGKVLNVLFHLYVEDFSFVRTVEIAQRLDVSAAHVRNVLKDYEGLGKVERKGSRGGWKPIEKVLSAEL